MYMNIKDKTMVLQLDLFLNWSLIISLLIDLDIYLSRNCSAFIFFLNSILITILKLISSDLISLILSVMISEKLSTLISKLDYLIYYLNKGLIKINNIKNVNFIIYIYNLNGKY